MRLWTWNLRELENINKFSEMISINHNYAKGKSNHYCWNFCETSLKKFNRKTYFRATELQKWPKIDVFQEALFFTLASSSKILNVFATKALQFLCWGFSFFSRVLHIFNELKTKKKIPISNQSIWFFFFFFFDVLAQFLIPKMKST